MQGRVPLIAGVAGGSASGKTTLVRAIASLLPDLTTALLHQDEYYRDWPDLPFAERARLNFDRPQALDNRLLCRHLRALKAGRAVQAPCYCFRTHRRLPDTHPVAPADIILLEGMLLLAAPSVRRLLDVAVFVDAPADLRLMRRIRRDTQERGRSLESVLRQYETTVRPMHDRHVEPSRQHAHLVVTNATDPTEAQAAAGLIRRHLRRRTPAASCARRRSPSRR